MPSLIIIREQGSLRLNNGMIEVHSRAEDGQWELVRSVPARDVERLVIGEQVHMTMPLLAWLLRNGVPIHVFSWSGTYLGNFLPEPKPDGSTRLRQYERVRDEAFVLCISRKIISAKIYNQRRVLQRLLSSRCRREEKLDTLDIERIRNVIDRLGQMMDQLHNVGSVEELRGVEGMATAAYYAAWSQFLPPEFPFERRTKRPPLNPVNACLSFGATILYHEAVAAIHAHGLDPALGVFHSVQNGRWSLALDLIEPFRPALVEALTLDLFSHQVLDQSKFETRDGGVFLNDEGRRKFFFHYETRMEREFMSEAVGHRTTLRRQLDYQVQLFKRALDDPDAYEGFVMN